MATDLQRTHMAGLMQWLVSEEPLIDYAQVRPMHKLSEQALADLFARGAHIAIDCSEAVTQICRLAGLADPNGAGYNGSGYTGTMLGHLAHYSDPVRAHVGALVVFGPGTGEHVCMVYQTGNDPLLFSHGQNRGPIFIRLSQERQYHQAPVTFLDISHL